MDLRVRCNEIFEAASQPPPDLEVRLLDFRQYTKSFTKFFVLSGARTSFNLSRYFRDRDYWRSRSDGNVGWNGTIDQSSFSETVPVAAAEYSSLIPKILFRMKDWE